MLPLCVCLVVYDRLSEIIGGTYHFFKWVKGIRKFFTHPNENPTYWKRATQQPVTLFKSLWTKHNSFVFFPNRNTSLPASFVRWVRNMHWYIGRTTSRRFLTASTAYFVATVRSRNINTSIFQGLYNCVSDKMMLITDGFSSLIVVIVHWWVE